MIVLGADMHKGSHSIAAVAGETGELLDDKTVAVGDRGFAAALAWARGLGSERVWALEDCRHVSGAFERFLVVRGERVVRVATRLMAGERRGGRERGKSDLIDALAIARAALREGVERLVAELAGVELDIRLLVDHRERLVRMRSALNNDLLWHLHDLWPRADTAGQRALVEKVGQPHGAALGAPRTERPGPDRPRRALPDGELSRTIDALEAEIAELVARVAPRLLAEPGIGPLTAGKLIGEIAGAQRFSSDTKLARAGGIAPVPVSSGKPTATASTAAATARSTPPSTASPSPRPLPPGNPRLHRTQTLPRQDQPRRHPLPQTPPSSPRLAATPTTGPPPIAINHLT